MALMGPSSPFTIASRRIRRHSPSCRCCWAASDTRNGTNSHETGKKVALGLQHEKVCVVQSLPSLTRYLYPMALASEEIDTSCRTTFQRFVRVPVDGDFCRGGPFFDHFEQGLLRHVVQNPVADDELCFHCAASSWSAFLFFLSSRTFTIEKCLKSRCFSRLR